MKRWKPVLIGAGVFLGLIAAMVTWIQIAAAGRWAETLRRTEELEKELASSSSARSPLRGAAVPGNAWDDYLAARPAGLSRTDLEAMERFLKGTSADRERTTGAVASLQPAIDKLREGSRRAFSLRPPGASIDARVVTGARAQARLEAEASGTASAFRILTDLVRVGQDDASGSRTKLTSLFGYLTAQQAIDELLTMLSRGGGAPADLDALAREAVLLEDTIPSPGRFLLMERVDTARKAEDVGVFGFSFASGGPGWRYAGSGRLHLSATLKRVEEWARIAHERRDGPWSGLARLRDEALRDAVRTDNKLLDIEASTILLESYAWELRTRLRLIRAGALHRKDGGVYEIDDPFGGKLRWDVEGVRSRGRTDDPNDDIILRLKP